MKKNITAASLAEMIILSTFIADSCMTFTNTNERENNALNLVLNARSEILKKVHENEDSEDEIYKATDAVFDKYQNRLEPADLIHLCRGFLGVYIRNYSLGYAFLSHFKDVHKYSSTLSRKAKNALRNKTEFINDIRSCTQTAVLDVK